MKISISLFITVCMVITTSCNRKNPNSNSLGELNFDVTASDEARPSFDRGLLLLHSFEYKDAAEEFLKAQQLDSLCVMAYWGEAMTYNHPLWQEQNYDMGQKALLKLGSSPEDRQQKAMTDIEKDFLSAIEILYGEGSKIERDKAYSRKMEELAKKYPGHHEVSAFYALSLLGSVPVGRDDEIYQQSARIVEGIRKENPNHPGALHYLIHANDDPYHAAKALDVAFQYSTVAPEAGHALHMPSHIFVALGMWDEVVRSNEASFQASVQRKERKQLDVSAYNYHSFHWLLYGYLQQGRLNRARDLVDQITHYHSEVSTPGVRAHTIFVKSTYLVETGDWDHAVSELVIEKEDLNISVRAMDDFISGFKAYRKGDMSSLRSIIEKMENDRNMEAVKLSDDGIAMCSSGATRSDATRQDVDQSLVMIMELKAMTSMLEGDSQVAEQWLKEASDLESTLSYSYGPPSVVKPSFELYADFLTEQNRPEEAMKYYELALKRTPKRVLSLKGMLKAATMLNDEKVKAEVKSILQEISEKADGMKEQV